MTCLAVGNCVSDTFDGVQCYLSVEIKADSAYLNAPPTTLFEHSYNTVECGKATFNINGINYYLELTINAK